MIRKTIAFTLAETLIVMGIIGVVSALTLPNLNSSTGEKEKVAKVKKLYQNFNDAYGRASAVYGPLSEWTINDADDKAKAKRIGERLTDFLKVSKNCEQNNTGGCFYNGNITDARGDGGVANTTINNNAYRFIVADGSSVAVLKDRIVVDINGPTKDKKGYGKDIFVFLLDNNDGVTVSNTAPAMSSVLSTSTTGVEPAYLVIQFDNMDYLKATDNSGKCPNGTTTLNALANPPIITCK